MVLQGRNSRGKKVCVMASFDGEDLQRELSTADSLNEIAYWQTTEVEKADKSANEGAEGGARISYLCSWVHKNQKEVFNFAPPTIRWSFFLYCR